VAAVGLLLAVPVLVVGYAVVAMMLSLLADVAPVTPAGCAAALPGVPAAAAGQSSLSDAQLHNAATIIGVGKQLGVPPQGWVVALATARQEASILNLASYANPGSLSHPHDGVAPGDHDSVGIFQQRDAWGPIADRMDVAASARMFFIGGQGGQRGLLDIPGWQAMSVAAAAQAVQVSAFPSAYAQWETLAVATVAALADVDTPTAVVCAAGSGSWVWPVPDGYTITARFGECSGLWSACHTGTDFDTAAGVSVSAVAAGVVAQVGWGGAYGNLVRVTHPDGVQTWYAHLSATTVRAGDRVQAGTVIGAVGATGNTTGAHLHLEVRVDDRPIDPLAWLRERVGRRQPTEPVAAGGTGLFTIATFNVLGHSHTEPGGKAPGMASGSTRTRWALRLLERHGVDVVGLQEFQSPQHRAFTTATTRGAWGVFPGPGPHNAIAWLRSSFTLTGSTRVPIPYFDGQPVRMPVVRLRHHASGQQLLVVNVHNPADTAAHPRQGRWRRMAKHREVSLVHRLHREHGLPVFLVGDMNETTSYHCAATASGLMTSAAGGSHTGRSCTPPRPTLIDQILATRPARFTGYTVDRGPVGRVSDHPLVLARVR
jgi:murein DD-endopeptidase MepM/ murein hydrolase activator NlpD/endonuclease/exonuclease/phosphatase family metal-dependent hydrolase